MNYCTNCGNKVEENSYVCVKCGFKIKNDVINENKTNDNGGIGWGVLGFFVPLVGLILYLVWKDEKPKTAKSVGKGALIYAIVYGAIIVIAFILGFLFTFSGISIDNFIEETINEINDYNYDYDYDFD